MAVPSSIIPLSAISHCTALSIFSTAAWSIVSGHCVKLSPAKIVRPILSFLRLFTKFAATSFAASMRLGLKSIASILVETSVASMISIPSMSLSSQLSDVCGRARTIITIDSVTMRKANGRCTSDVLSVLTRFAKGSSEETFIAESILLPFSRYHTTYAISGIKSNKYDILAKNISINFS